MAPAIERRLAREDSSLEGYCCICQDIVAFKIVRAPPPGWTDLRESVVCPKCGMNGRLRLLADAVRQAVSHAGKRFYVLERVTPFFKYLKSQFPHLRGSEYVSPEARPGSTHVVHGLDVEHQDFLNLSFEDGSIDLLVHGDVLEHVPDHQIALAEAARVIAPNGQMIFTCPFYDLDQHLVRCRIENGQFVNKLPPGYHGNPMSAEGSLVFMHPAWPLLSDLIDAGFSTAEIGLCYDPYQGIVSNNNPYPDGQMWPVVFRASK